MWCSAMAGRSGPGTPASAPGMRLGPTGMTTVLPYAGICRRPDVLPGGAWRDTPVEDGGRWAASPVTKVRAERPSALPFIPRHAGKGGSPAAQIGHSATHVTPRNAAR